MHIKKYAKLFSTIPFIIIVFLTIAGQPVFSQPTSMTVDLDETGIAIVHVRVVVNGAEALPCIGSCLYVANYTGDIDYTIDNNTIVIVSKTESAVDAILSYATTLAEENNGLWNLSFYSPVNVTIVLPSNTVPKNMNPIPTDVSISNGRVVLLFPAGQVSITYTLTQTITSSQTITTSAATTSTTTSVTTSSATASGTQRNITPVYTGIIAIIAVAIIIAVGMTVFRKR